MSAKQQRCSSEQELKADSEVISGRDLADEDSKEAPCLPSESPSTLQSLTLSPNNTFKRLIRRYLLNCSWKIVRVQVSEGTVLS